MFSDRLNPVDDGGPLLFGGVLFCLIRGHFLGLELFEHGFPPAIIRDDGGGGRVRPEIELSFLFLFAVASEAVGFEEGMDRVGEPPIEVDLDGVRRESAGEHAPEKREDG